MLLLLNKKASVSSDILVGHVTSWPTDNSDRDKSARKRGQVGP
jgi:hypothetical protein